jgi:hypothetical protein
LIVLDNCGHGLAAAAEPRGSVLQAADDGKFLAAGRDRIGQAGGNPAGLPPT